jgi:hypothetical protein
LIEKLPDQRSFFFIFDAREELRSQPRDSFGFVEWHFVVNLAALEVAGLTTSLKDRLDLAIKIRFIDRRYESFDGSLTHL